MRHRLWHDLHWSVVWSRLAAPKKANVFIGVAYQKIPKNPVGHQPSPQVFRHWPGSAYNVDKVPTTIFYDADGHVTSWGLLTDEEPDQSKVTRLWKLALSTGGQLGPTSAIPLEEAEKHFTSYLKHLYQNLDEKFREWFPRDEYAEMVIEYLFSVPVTWSSPTVAKIERLIKSTSFGTARSCSAKVSLTEADAAAVDVIPERKVGDVVLVCDAGGGTSDIAVTKLLSDEDEPTKLKHLTKVMGNKCGSTHIDAAARQYLTGRLKEAFGAEKAAKTAATMVKGEFQVKKHDFGTPFSKERGCHLNVPGIGDGQNNSSAGIKDSKMEIPVSVLEGWFDDQAKGMIDLISGQLQATKTRFPDEKVKYLVFSGGLGKNLYIRDRLRRFVAEQRSFQSNANDLEVLLAQEPQLVVVRGLVKDRVQEICRGVVIFDMVCCRESYGMKTREEYDRKRHRGPEPEKDEKDGKRWVYNRIDWVIKQVSQPIPVKLLIDHFNSPSSLGRIDLARRHTSNVRRNNG